MIKKIRLVVLQLVMSALLIAFGFIVEKNGDQNTGMAVIYMMVPGAVLALNIFIGFIRFRKIWIHTILMVLLVGGADFYTINRYGLVLDDRLALMVLAAVDVMIVIIATSINFMLTRKAKEEIKFKK